MFGANKRLKDLGKESSTMYNPNFDASSDNRPLGINTKEKNNKLSKGVSGVKIFVFIYVGMIILGVVGAFTESFEDFDFDNFIETEDEYIYVDTDQNIEDVVIFEDEWANKYYTYLTKYNATKGIECDEIAFVDLDNNGTPELLIHSTSEDFVEYLVEIENSSELRMYYLEGNIKDIKLYNSINYDYDMWAFIVQNNDYYDNMDLYKLDNIVSNNANTADTTYKNKAIFSTLFTVKDINVVFTEIDDLKNSFNEAISNYNLLNNTLNLMK